MQLSSMDNIANPRIYQFVDKIIQFTVMDKNSVAIYQVMLLILFMTVHYSATIPKEILCSLSDFVII